MHAIEEQRKEGMMVQMMERQREERGSMIAPPQPPQRPPGRLYNRDFAKDPYSTSWWYVKLTS